MRRISLMVFTMAALITTSAFAQQHVRNLAFASDFQTIPVAANVPGIGGTFQSYVALFNPTSSAFSVTASLYDATGTKRTAVIPLAAGGAKKENQLFLPPLHRLRRRRAAAVFESPPPRR